MKQFLRYAILIILIFTATQTFAQNKNEQDSVVQLYGVVMTADSLQAIPAASVIVENKLRGTFTNDHGVFSIVVLKGDRIRFSCIGFKDKEITIPTNLQGDQYSVIQLMVSDTNYLPATILRPRPTRAQFERDFVNTDVPADQIEIARENTADAKRRALIAALPQDGQEAVAAQMRQQATKYSYLGQVPPQNIFNPMAWAEFIQAWKRGDFKRKD
jgi:CarboxypepD_reg-like domain